MHGTYKMSQTGMHEFAIHDKGTGSLVATITLESSGGWSTTVPADDMIGPSAEVFEEQRTAQAAFNAFVERRAGEEAPDAAADAPPGS